MTYNDFYIPASYIQHDNIIVIYLFHGLGLVRTHVGPMLNHSLPQVCFLHILRLHAEWDKLRQTETDCSTNDCMTAVVHYTPHPIDNDYDHSTHVNTPPSPAPPPLPHIQMNSTMSSHYYNMWQYSSQVSYKFFWSQFWIIENLPTTTQFANTRIYNILVRQRNFVRLEYILIRFCFKIFKWNICSFCKYNGIVAPHLLGPGSMHLGKAFKWTNLECIIILKILH